VLVRRAAPVEHGSNDHRNDYSWIQRPCIQDVVWLHRLAFMAECSGRNQHDVRAPFHWHALRMKFGIQCAMRLRIEKEEINSPDTARKRSRSPASPASPGTPPPTRA
jgi:hypothetical protein